MGRHPVRLLLAAQLQDRVRRATNLECANLLRILALEEHSHTGAPVDTLRHHDRCTMHERTYPIVCRAKTDL